MKNASVMKCTLVLAALLALPAAQAATMAKADYKAAKARIGADYKVDKNACAAQADNARDICIEEAKAKEKVARAELEYGYSGKPADANKVLVAKAKSAYAVAKERCDDKAGNDKGVCVAEAKAAQTKALAAAKMGSRVGEARKDAAEERKEADYKVAVEKCEAMAGVAKTSCVAAAKEKYGRT